MSDRNLGIKKILRVKSGKPNCLNQNLQNLRINRIPRLIFTCPKNILSMDYKGFRGPGLFMQLLTYNSLFITVNCSLFTVHCPLSTSYCVEI
jgi:hypothetical protein